MTKITELYKPCPKCKTLMGIAMFFVPTPRHRCPECSHTEEIQGEIEL